MKEQLRFNCHDIGYERCHIVKVNKSDKVLKGSPDILC